MAPSASLRPALLLCALVLMAGGCVQVIAPPDFCESSVDGPESVGALPFEPDAALRVHTFQPAPDDLGGVLLIEAELPSDDLYVVRYEADGTVRFSTRVGHAYKISQEGPAPTASLGPSGWAVTWSHDHEEDHRLVLVDDATGQSREVGSTPSLGRGSSLTWMGESFLLITTDGGLQADASTWTAELEPLTGPRDIDGYTPGAIRQSFMGPGGPALRLTDGAWMLVDEEGNERTRLTAGQGPDTYGIDVITTDEGWVSAWVDIPYFERTTPFTETGWNESVMAVTTLDNDLEPDGQSGPIALSEDHQERFGQIALSRDGTALVYTTEGGTLGAVALGDADSGTYWDPEFTIGEAGCRSVTTGGGRVLQVERDGSNLTTLLLHDREFMVWQTVLDTQD